MRPSFGIFLLAATLGLTGCVTLAGNDPATASSTATSPATPVAPYVVISGNVHGGLAPVSGAHVYLMAVNTTGYGAASISILNSSVTGQSDSTGAYVLTDNVGGYSILSSAINCTSDQYTYLLATGGNAGVGVNSAISLLAAVGPCQASSTSATAWINEVTTVGTAYALAGFATDALHISSSGSAAALQGVKNAFSVVPNLYSPATGQARSVTPNGNGTVPQQTIDTVANILGACINTSAPSSPACLSLFGAVSAPPTSSDTASAAIAIAHKPAAYADTLFALQTSGGTLFQPSRATAPTSLILPIQYTGGGLNNPLGLAVDASGNVWVGNGTNGSRNAFSAAGIPLSSTGFSDGLTGSELTVSIDSSGDVWGLDSSANGISELSPSGAVAGPVSQFATAQLDNPLGLAFDKSGMFWVGDDKGVTRINPNGQIMLKLAIPSSQGEGVGDVEVDGLGNVWATNFDNNQLVKLTSAGVPIFGIAGVSGGGLKSPEGIAIDAQNNLWVANANASNISKFGNNGAPLSPTGFSGGGLSGNRFLAIDGSGMVWTPSSNTSIISEFDTSGNPVIPTGFTAEPSGKGFWGIAIDGSGNVWSTAVDGALVQLVGAATPVLTPITTAAANNMLATRP
jgi:streptogramin lyase